MKQETKTPKIAMSQNTRESLEAIVTVITIFAVFYAAIWIGNAIGLH